MNNILDDLSASSLTSAIEENLFANLSPFSKWPRAETYDETDILWAITDIPFSGLNNVMRAHLAPSQIETAIASVTAKARSRKVPLNWWTGPATQPANLGEYLESHGFVSVGEMVGMAVILENLNENASMPEGFTIRPVVEDETLKQWCQVCIKGNGMPDFVEEGYFDIMHYLDPNHVRVYLGMLHGEPVATSLLFLAAGVAGIGNVATLPAVRRQGIGTQMTLTPLLEARRLGYKAGVLQATKMGAGVYRSLGFQEYCRLGVYGWPFEHEAGVG
jgi:GNAT superfamily N-acetyltransferase